MDVVPSTKSLIKSRSSRSRHGSLKGTSPVRRQPSPDSACEHDGEWLTGSAVSGQEDMTSDMSEESGEKSSRVVGRRTSLKEATVSRRKFGEAGIGKGLAGQDSDVDSGIVTCRKPGQRISSTSSADTDSSQESRRKIEYSPPTPKSELSKSRSYAGSLRIPRRSSCLSQSGGPIKGDHSALKECNRRPPTPLTVFPDSHQCVRFDEQLQLSEQNIRRSCRKLFATLYAQRFYPSYQDGTFIHGRSCSGSTRMRSRTVPELDLRRFSPVSVDGQSKHGRSYKENLGPSEGRRSGSLSWNSRTVHKSMSDASIGEKITPSPHMQRYKLHSYSRLPMEFNEGGISHTNSTDSGLGSLRNSTHCTCHNRQSGTTSSQSTSIPVQCTCRCCNCGPRSPEHPSKLFKSSSCSTLPSVLSHQSRPHLTQFPPRTSSRKISLGDERPKPTSTLQKTSSCSSLLDRTSSTSLHVANVPVYSDNMVQVYARIASVIPDDLKSSSGSQGGRRAKTLGRLRYTTDNVCDSIRQQPNVSVSASVSPSPKPETPRVSTRKVNSFGTEVDLTSVAPEILDVSNATISKRANLCNNDTEVKSVHSVDIYSQISDNVSDSFGRKSLRESVQSRTSSNYQRPKSVGVVIPSCGSNPVYLKSALKKSTQSAMLHVKELSALESQAVLNGDAIIPSEVEYAVVDKSKKNRFTSLPVLNGPTNTSISIHENEEKDPPVPPKKLLHKSDFSLYRSRSSSPKKSLLERMQSLSKSAKSALQKAFSTERIYRPEREERMEAHKGLQRSRSFIKGLTGSFRKKRRKSRPPTAELLPRASPNPEWDEQPSGPNSPIHVRGQLLQLNLDGSQVVELTKPQGKPYGFFVARGRVRNSKGIFVSRMRDQETQKQLAGLLDIGDEILEIDGFHVKEAEIMEVNRLMANKNTLLLTVLPYICRKDI